MNEHISVWLTHSHKIRRQFRCVNCGKIVFEFYGEVRSIVFGENEVSDPTIIQCKGTFEKHDIMGNRYSERCHTKYVIS